MEQWSSFFFSFLILCWTWWLVVHEACNYAVNWNYVVTTFKRKKEGWLKVERKGERIYGSLWIVFMNYIKICSLYINKIKKEYSLLLGWTGNTAVMTLFCVNMHVCQVEKKQEMYRNAPLEETSFHSKLTFIMQLTPLKRMEFRIYSN